MRPMILAYPGCMRTPCAAEVTSDGFVAMGTCWAKDGAARKRPLRAASSLCFVFIGSFEFERPLSFPTLGFLEQWNGNLLLSTKNHCNSLGSPFSRQRVVLRI